MKPTKHVDVFIMILIFVLVALVLSFAPQPAAYADIIIAGQDQSNNMTDLKNLLTTIQSVNFHMLAYVVGGFIAFFGIIRIYNQQFMQGIIALGCGASMFILEKLAQALSKAAGGG